MRTQDAEPGGTGEGGSDNGVSGQSEDRKLDGSAEIKVSRLRCPEPPLPGRGKSGMKAADTVESSPRGLDPGGTPGSGTHARVLDPTRVGWDSFPEEETSEAGPEG